MSSTPGANGPHPATVAALPWDEVTGLLAGPARVMGLRPGQELPRAWPAPDDPERGTVVLIAPTSEQDLVEAHRSAAGHPLVVVVPNLARPAFVRALLVGGGDECVPGWMRAALTRTTVDRLLTDLGRRRRPVPAGRPAARTGRPLDDLLGEVAARAGFPDQPWVVSGYDEARVTDPTTPARFLTVLLRTQGNRPGQLADVLLCLAAQTCDDFDVLLLAHQLDAPAREALDRLVGDQPGDLHDRITVLPVEGGGRSARSPSASSTREVAISRCSTTTTWSSATGSRSSGPAPSRLPT